ncbi:MAG TPA: zinc ribbon domain-containing protein [Rudaea sp.]|jgi:putative FmdB family regulatory protein|nr:zinc ribbon domain-containing protein [Rudaea sp.]
MPIYAFECNTCGDQFDRLQKLSDPDPSVCPECGGHTVKRRVTAPSFRLAGSGWYETDFKKDSDKKRNLADKAEVKSESKPDSGKSDSGKSESSSGESKNADSKKAESKPESKPAEKKEKPAAAKSKAAE